MSLLPVADGSLPVSPSLFRYGNDVVERNGTLDQGARTVSYTHLTLPTNREV